MTAKPNKDHKYWFDQLQEISNRYPNDPLKQALYRQGLFQAWLSRLAQHDWQIQHEIEARKESP